MSRSIRFAICLFVAAVLAFAQDRGTITGNITDNSGAVVPSARITLQNPATGYTQSTLSATDGSYTCR